MGSRLNYSMLLVMSGCGTPARDVRFRGVSAQSVDATQALNRSARVSKPKVSRDRSLSCRVTRLNCECAPPAVPQLLLLGHRVETSNVSSTHRYPLHLLRLR